MGLHGELMLPLSDIIGKNNACFHSHADGTQLYISAEPNYAAAIDYISFINKTIGKLNREKTEILLVLLLIKT